MALNYFQRLDIAGEKRAAKQMSKKPRKSKPASMSKGKRRKAKRKRR